MFGLSPVPEPERSKRSPAVVYQAGLVGALLFGLGLVCLILILALSASLVTSWLSALVIGLPLLIGSGLGLALGYAALHTRIELAGDRLAIVAPAWRGFPAPPLQHLSVTLDEITALRRRTERHGIALLRLELPVEVYAIETIRGRIVLASYYLSELEAVLAEVFARSGCAREDDGEVRVGVLRLLCRGAPDWRPATPACPRRTA